ncbi:MAG: phosphate acyltransferase PlsX [Defluviitaleaceae bacterium]|nr:phosphate acyltransferase PlsX [Defluviitaleaceae bacterium]
MRKLYKIGIDAMGGDHAPAEIVKGAYMAVEHYPDIEVTLFGQEEAIRKHLPVSHDRIQIIHCDDVIPMDVKDPAMAIRRQKASSLVVASRAVKQGDIEALVSAGATGALIAAGTLLVKRLKSVDRPALAPLLPTVKKDKHTILCDAGATSESKAHFIYQNAKLADIYAKTVLGMNKPKIGLLNIGTEDAKGGIDQQEAFLLLKNDHSLNFLGNIESKSMISGTVDIIATDGYAGNIALKAVEGTAKDIFSLLKEEIMSTTQGKIGGLLLKSTFAHIKETINPKTVGGAILLGIQAPIIKSPGSSDAETVMHAIHHAKKAIENDVINKIDAALSTSKDDSLT